MQLRRQIHESATACPQCGALNGVTSNSKQPPSIEVVDIPDGVKGWSWGAFLLSWIWAIGNRTWIGLLALIPYLGAIMAIVLGIKGREWAWKNKQWESVEHFNAVQRKWSVWGGIFVAGASVIGIIAAIALPAYQDYTARTQAMKDEPTETASPAFTPPNSNPAASAPSSPYPMPQLAFDQVDFIGSMKRAQMEPKWMTEFTTYLIRPGEFWTNCISSEAGIAQELGGMNATEAHQHAKQACQSTANQLYQCLNGTPLGNAMMCLQDHINNIEANGQ